MIVVVAPEPPPRGRPAEGFFQRVEAIDEILADRPRLYLHFSTEPGWAPRGKSPLRACGRFHGAQTLKIYPDSAVHLAQAAEALAQASIIYCHSLYEFAHLVPFLEPLPDLGKKCVLDFHGLVPEEEALRSKDPRTSQRFSELEAQAAQRVSGAWVHVTRSMQRHFAEKYSTRPQQEWILPIISRGQKILERPAPRKKPLIVYAGGAQAWQQVDTMLASAAENRAHLDALFLSPEKRAFRIRLEALGIKEGADLSVRSAAPSEVASHLLQADFGFILRRDEPLNRVSCPTKLAEYLAAGVVPVVESPFLGDFVELGYCYVPVKDLPEWCRRRAELESRREQNYQVWKALRASYEEGAAMLRRHCSQSATVQTTSGDFAQIGRRLVKARSFTFTELLRVARLRLRRELGRIWRALTR